MGRERLTAFSDGVIAVIITIMVLELKAPAAGTLAGLAQLAPPFLCYALSFVYVGIYWNNHHHVFQLVERVNGAVLWANLHLLFWLSLIPFATAWMAAHGRAPVPGAGYGAVLLLSALAWWVMQAAAVRAQGTERRLAAALGRDLKGKASPALYLVGIGSAFADARIAEAIYMLVALIWLVPDRRIEKAEDS